MSKHARMGTLPRHFGPHMMALEGRVFDLMREYCADYSGGCWQFYELSNGGFYMVPHMGRVSLSVPDNGYRGEKRWVLVLFGVIRWNGSFAGDGVRVAMLRCSGGS